VLNGLALRIENGALGHDPDVSFHGESIAGPGFSLEGEECLRKRFRGC
jgi:hypothetical protein